jgi:DNA-binding transcriptional LysR family regulator
MMRLAHIRYLIVLAEELHFTRAARRCHISQPSLTNAIKSLERSLGGALFTRHKPVALTKFGKKVKPLLERAYQTIERAKFEPPMMEKPSKGPVRS